MCVSCRFTFDHVYDQDSTQSEVYDQTAKPLVLSTLQVGCTREDPTWPRHVCTRTAVLACPCAGLQCSHHCIRADGHREDVHHGRRAGGASQGHHPTQVRCRQGQGPAAAGMRAGAAQRLQGMRLRDQAAPAYTLQLCAWQCHLGQMPPSRCRPPRKARGGVWHARRDVLPSHVGPVC